MKKKVLIAGLVLLPVIVTLVAYFPGAHYVIIEHEMSRRAEWSSTCFVTGTVKNIGALKHDVVVVRVTWYDEQGNEKRSSRDVISDFWNKDSPGYNSRTATFRVKGYVGKDISDYKIWLESGASQKYMEYLYEDDRYWVESAVAESMTGPTDRIHNPPIQDIEDVLIGGGNVNGSGIKIGEEYYPVAICRLLIHAFPMGILREVPPSCEAKNCADTPRTEANKRFNSGSSDGMMVEGGGNWAPWYSCAHMAVEKNVSISCAGHYRWLTTLTGDVASICIGSGCAKHGEDGYQGVYP